EQGHAEGEVERATALFELARVTRQRRRASRGEHPPGQAIEGIERLTLGERRDQRSRQRKRRHPVEVVDLPRAHSLLDSRQGGELPQLLAASPQVNPRHVARGGPVSGIELYHHVVQLVVTGERADPAAAEEGLERGRDVA